MKYEVETLAKVVSLRNSAAQALGVAQKAAREGELSVALRQVFALSEKYPDLKAQASFQQLQGRITELENQIADRRELYNESVNNYNIRIQSFPDRLVAGYMELTPQEMFKVSEADRQDVTIDIKVP
jgi:LemA protein